MSEFSWSYSAFSSAVTCLRKFKYAYIDKIVPEGPESGDLLFGTALHAAINASLTGKNGKEVFELYWELNRDKDVEYGRHKWDALSGLGSEFMRKFEKQYAKRYELEFAEERLFSDYKGIRLEGTLDFFGKFDDRTSLRDFKTSGTNYHEAKSDSALQLYLYAYLYYRHLRTLPETLGYTVFNKGSGTIQHMTWEFSENDMYRALDDLVSYANIIKPSTEFPRNLNACMNYNRKCEYFDKCFPKEVTNEC